MSGRTLYDKLIDAHVVRKLDDDGLVLLYVDRTVLNEYTSPQAFAGLRAAGRKVWNPSAALMVVDHVNPTAERRTREMPDAEAAGRSTISPTTRTTSASSISISSIRARASSMSSRPSRGW